MQFHRMAFIIVGRQATQPRVMEGIYLAFQWVQESRHSYRDDPDVLVSIPSSYAPALCSVVSRYAV